MGYDNNLMTFFRDGANEGVALTILGSLRSLQQQQYPSLQSPVPRILSNQEYSQQTEGDNNMIDRAAVTRDRDRERACTRFSKNIDVRYMKSFRYLRDKLSSYSCSSRHCPAMSERLERHRRELHATRRVSHCDAAHECNLDHSRANIRPACSASNQRRVLPSASSVTPERETVVITLDKCAAASCCSVTKESPGQHQLVAVRSSTFPGGKRRNQEHKSVMTIESVCNRFKTTSSGPELKNAHTESLKQHQPILNNKNVGNDEEHSSRTDLLGINKCTSIASLRSYEIANVAIGTDQCTNIKTDNCNYFGLNKKYENRRRNNRTNTGRNSNSATKQLSTLKKNIEHNPSLESISLTNIKEPLRRAKKNRCTLTKIIVSNNKSCCIDRERNNSKISNDTRRDVDISPFRREVRNWMRDIPMNSGLSSKDKERNDDVFNNLIHNLNKLSMETSKTEFEQRARNEIQQSLNKLPLWYPTNVNDHYNYRNYLSALLSRRVTNIIKKSIQKPIDEFCTSSRRINKDVVTEVTSAVFLTNQMQYSDNQLVNLNKINKTIMEWLWSIYQETNNKDIVANLTEIADFIIVRANPLINKPVGYNSHCKLILETALTNIINDLPIIISNDKLLVQRFTEELADRIFSAQTVLLNRETILAAHTSAYNKYYGLRTLINKYLIQSEVKKCFRDGCFELEDMVIEEVSTILVDLFTKSDPDTETNVRHELFDLLMTTTHVSEAQIIDITDAVIDKLKNTFGDRNAAFENNKTWYKPKKTITSSVYTSIEGCSTNCPVTSTPKKKLEKRAISRLNPQETQYMEQVAKLVRAWMDTLPESFDAPEEKDFKETMVYNLAGDIMDEAKREQIKPRPKEHRDLYLKYYVARWVHRLGTFEVEDVDEQIENFLMHLKGIPIPNMTQPQHGNRQAMANMKFAAEASWHDDFIPKGSDILEDEISIWMNEQPCNMFVNKDQESRQIKIHELAQILGNKLKNKSPKSEIAKDVAKWLNSIVEPERKRDVNELAESLKDRVIKIPQDDTLAAKHEEKVKDRAEYMKRMKARSCSSKECSNENNNDTTDQDDTIKMFVSKFIEHNYDVDDPLARRAFNRLLRTHIQRLNPPHTKKEVYDSCQRNEDEGFPPRKLIRELEYIKDVSDWLKNLPLDASYNTLGNRDRIEFINGLVVSIREIEEERESAPDAMDHNMYLAYMILEYMCILPIPEIYKNNFGFMANQLATKIITHRQAVADKLNESTNCTGVNTENIGDFIEEFIRVNGDEIANDEIKLEAWATRLVKEVKTVVQANPSDPALLSKANVYGRLTQVPMPGDETAKLFSLELDYVKEITSWLKNLPLLPVNETEEDNRTKMICRLAEKITEFERNKNVSSCTPCETQTDDAGLKEFIAKWLSNFPLDPSKEIILPVAIEQLLNRIKRVQRQEGSMESDFSKLFNSLNDTSKPKKPKSPSAKNCGKNKVNQTTSNLMVGVIEKCVKELPFQDSQADIKGDVSRKLFQKVGDLNMDPRAYNDDVLYQTMLINEVDLIFEQLPPNDAMKKNEERLKADLIDAIMEARNDLKEKTAGDTYKKKLENTIDASIPNPVSQHQVYEPGFEIYKDRLAKMFIIENFDNGTDLVKIKYERLLKKEIDKYFDSAKNRNAVPITKEKLYLELYYNLFKVSIPNEASIVAEVEEVKTRCEIDAWFEELPIREASGLNEMLEWDKMLSTLAKRIHEIETSNPKPEQEISKEIKKWIVKLPLKPGNQSKLQGFTVKLQERLKSTVCQRKCIRDCSKSPKSKKGKEKVKVKSAAKSINDSQVAGPSSKGQMWTSTCAKMSEPIRPKKKAANEILEIIQAWCEQIPINATPPVDSNILKDNLITKIMIKIGELNANPDIFGDDMLYNKFLDDELENLLSPLPTPCGFDDSKEARKFQLKEAIKATKRLIREERDHHKYKQELNKSVDKVLQKQHVITDKEVNYDEIKSNIIDDFIEYECYKNEDEKSIVHKKNIQNNISKITSSTSNKDNVKPNILMTTNQLICELEIVSEKYHLTDLTDEVAEINMKKELSEFFKEFIFPSKNVDNAKVNYLKKSLAKKLIEIEMNGHTPENEIKMKYEIVKCLKKLDIEINNADIDAFIKKLKHNEMTRRKLQITVKNAGKEKICKEICQRSNQEIVKQGAQNRSTREQGIGPDYSIPDSIATSYRNVALPLKSTGNIQLQTHTTQSKHAECAISCKTDQQFDQQSDQQRSHQWDQQFDQLSDQQCGQQSDQQSYRGLEQSNKTCSQQCGQQSDQQSDQQSYQQSYRESDQQFDKPCGQQSNQQLDQQSEEQLHQQIYEENSDTTLTDEEIEYKPRKRIICGYRDREKCICCGKPRYSRRKPLCMVPMRRRCESFRGTNLMWWGIPMPGCYM